LAIKYVRFQEVSHTHHHHTTINSQLYPSNDLRIRFFSFLHFVHIHLSRETYRQIGERNQKRKEVKNVLDIGTATGHPLHSIIDNF